MVESACIPLDQREILAIVFRVTPYTFLTGVRVQVITGVQPSSRRDTGCDFAVAIDTLKRGLAATQFMTGGTVARAIERLVGTRKSTGRDLCYRTTRKPQEQNYEEGQAQ